MKVVLIDDEKLALEYLEYQLNLIGDLEIVGKYTDPLQGKQAIENHDIDIVFLDIHIPEINGIELAELLLERNPDLQVVFVTAHDEYAIKAFELNALDYMLKPVRKDRLKLTVQRMSQRKAETAGSALFHHDNWQIRMFDEFTIADGNQKNWSLHWRTVKAQEIFYYLLHRRGKIVSKATLVELLWPEFDYQKGSAQLYTAVYHIRKTLQPFGDRVLLQKKTDGYVLKLEGIYLDVDEFERFLQSEMRLTDDSVSQYERMLKLFTGEYLEGHDYMWAEHERQRYQLHWIRMKTNLVHWYVNDREFEKAFKHCENICRRYPMEEQAQFMLMKICDRMGNHFLIQSQYALIESIMNKELNEQPDPEIRQWYVQWVKKQQKE